MALLFTETGIISRFLLHHVWGHYLGPTFDTRRSLSCMGLPWMACGQQDIWVRAEDLKEAMAALEPL
jgi:hypothetical protein